MQFRILIAVIIFVGSYLPLSLILLAQNYDYAMISRPICWRFWDAGVCSVPLKNPGFSVGIFLACVSCFFITLVTLWFVKPKHEVVIKAASHVPADLMNYTLPYVVSFMSIDYQDTGKFVGFLIFLSWMFWITYKSGQIILNPLLIAFNWRLYEITFSFSGDDTEYSSKALVLGAIGPGERHRQIPVQDILVIKNKRERL